MKQYNTLKLFSWISAFAGIMFLAPKGYEPAAIGIYLLISAIGLFVMSYKLRNEILAEEREKILRHQEYLMGKTCRECNRAY